MKFDMSDFMAFFGSGGALLPQDRLILRSGRTTPQLPCGIRGCERQACWCHGMNFGVKGKSGLEAALRRQKLKKHTLLVEVGKVAQRCLLGLPVACFG